MFFQSSIFAAVAALLSAAVAVPSAPFRSENAVSAISKRGLNCNSPVWGLSREDCQHMSNIGFGSMGKNNGGNNGAIWVGNDGHTTFTFVNRADEGGPATITVVVWLQTDGQSSFVNVRQPYVTWSLPNTGDSVTVSMAQGISGAFAALNHRITILKDGQVFNTWGEWSTGPYATVDVSREPNMGGNRMEIQTSGGCHANMDRCVFKCKNGNRCGRSGEYYLQNCEPGSQGGNPHIGYDQWGNPSGGCGGLENGGHATVEFHN
ncbi:cysteine synthase [Cordyceps javanica]|uniref:Cysteine synthase n=1 Tax=Cordyceps javanica TaxID=43265 RepID=A0A545VGM4_9HYPO|nr:cysteine synthase [Cordyceps javanica]TQW12051.1 cysteine synthase [Cordyceps javanica]